MQDKIVIVKRRTNTSQKSYLLEDILTSPSVSNVAERIVMCWGDDPALRSQTLYNSEKLDALGSPEAMKKK